jgi:hypothetical protein
MQSKRASSNPMEEPLFVEFLNTRISKESIESFLTRLESVFPEKEDKLIVKDHRESLKDHHLEGYKLVQTKFKDHVDHLITTKNFDRDFSVWANFYLSSLRESKNEDRFGNMERRVRIGDKTGDWFSGILLYNFSLFCKYYGSEFIRQCDARVYFVTRQKWEKYCSAECKESKKCIKRLEVSAEKAETLNS